MTASQRRHRPKVAIGERAPDWLLDPGDLKPGITETELWSTLWDGNFRRYGEWVETRVLSSGPRTNAWYHGASSRVNHNGDFMGFDTDMVGAYGDVSTFRDSRGIRRLTSTTATPACHELLFNYSLDL